MGLEPGIQVTDRVTLVRRLGEGSMGEVWVGRHSTLESDVAVKFISAAVMRGHEDAYERFSREAAAAARIKSPHVVTIFDHGTLDDGTPFIVMELLEGSTLQQRLEIDGQLPLEDVATLLRHVGSALDAAHAEAIIHRDIKPHNIFLVEQSSGEIFAKVVDFGSAKLGATSSGTARLTLPGMVVGTPEYISPDIIESPAAVDHYLDLWALGVVTYKCLTGTLPFAGEGIGEVGAAIVEGRFSKPSRVADVDPRFDGWFARVFSHDRKNRPASGAEMAAAFRKHVKAATRTLRPQAPAAGLVVGRRETPWILIAAGATAVAAAAVVVAARSGGQVAPAASTTASAAASSTATVPAVPSASVSVAATVDEATTPTVELDATAAPTAVTSNTASASAALADAPPPLEEGTHPDPPLVVERAAPAMLAAFGAQRVTIPAGPFWMGCSKNDQQCEEHEKPGRSVELGPFTIDKFEVSVGLYTRCVQSGVCDADELRGFRLEGGPHTRSSKCNWGQSSRQNHPMNCIDYEDAHRYCQWAGGRLPTEAEWEKAARGTDQRVFPWAGDQVVCAVAVMNEGTSGCRAHGTWPIGSKRAGASPFGVLNMAGNVREWVADRFGADYFRTAPTTDPNGPASGALRVGKGGSWGNGVARFLRLSTREGLSPDTRAIHLGFRCAADPP